MLYFALLIDMRRSSSGCRSTSSTDLGSSGISSMKRTPLWAKLISPGWGFWPPPTSATGEMVWCGALNGLCRMSGLSVLSFPAMECICVVSRLSSSDSGGRIVGRRFAASRRSYHDDVMSACCCYFECSLYELLSFDVGEVDVELVLLFEEHFLGVECRRLELVYIGEEENDLGEVFHAVNFEAADNGCLLGVGFG